MSSSPSRPEESQSQQAPRYWCYTCNAEVPIYMAPDPTCQQCNEQFIEEIDSENDPRTFLAGAPAATTTTTVDGDEHTERTGGDHQHHHQAFIRYETGDEDDIFQLFAPMGGRPLNTEGGLGSGGIGGGDEQGNPNQPPLANMIQNLLTSMLGPAAEGMQRPGAGGNTTGTDGGDTTTTSGDQQQQRSTPSTTTEGGEQPQSQQQRLPRPVVFYGSMMDGNMQFRPMNIPTQQQNTDGEGGEDQDGQGDENRPPNNFASLLQLLSTLVGSNIDGGFVGNPDDYVFSQGALDNIISQLMEQTSGRNAPPPAPETVIDSLPKRKLTDEEIAQQTDCAVCKDEFEGTEQVIELPCAHVFHEDCIKPWLKVNGTCPVCRHSVIGEKEESSNNTDREENNGSSSSTQPSSSEQSSTTQVPPPSSTSPATAQNNNNNQPTDPTATLSSLLFENARRMYNDRTPGAATWHTTIPGPFTWGPGGRTNNPTSTSSSNNNNNNNNSATTSSSTTNNNNSNNNTQQSSGTDPSETDPMDLDLD